MYINLVNIMGVAYTVHECMLEVVQSTDQQKETSFLKVLAEINCNIL